MNRNPNLLKCQGITSILRAEFNWATRSRANQTGPTRDDVGYAASAGLPPESLEHVMELHQRFSAPLREALADRGDPDPEVTTELITGTLEGAIRLIDAGHAPEEVLEATLAFLSERRPTDPNAESGRAAAVE